MYYTEHTDCGKPHFISSVSEYWQLNIDLSLAEGNTSSSSPLCPAEGARDRQRDGSPANNKM